MLSRNDGGVTQGPDVVRMLLSAGADPNAITSSGVTARQWAKRRGDREILALLGPEARRN